MSTALRLVVTIAVLAGTPRQADALVPVRVDGAEPSYELGLALEILEDPGGNLTLTDVTRGPASKRFLKSETKVPNFGYTSSAYWFRFELDNPSRKQLRFFLEVAYAMVDHLDLFVQQKSGRYSQRTVGDTFPHGNKVIPHQHFIFPFELDATQRKRVYIRISTEGAVQLPLVLWTPDALLQREHRTQLALGLNYGLLGMALIFNLFIFMAIKDRSYLLYVLFVCSAIVYQSSFNGVAQEWFWPGIPWLANCAVPASVSTSLLLAILFAQAFLDLRRRFPRWHKLLTVMALLASAGIFGAFLAPYKVVIRYITALTVITCAQMVVLAVVAWRSEYRPARYYAASWGVFFTGITIYALNKFGLLPLNPVTEHIHEIGFAFKALLLSLALADRINLMQQEKNAAQAQTLVLQRRTSEDLEREVELKTQDLNLRTQEAERASAEAISATAEAMEARRQAEEARQQAEQTKGQLEEAYAQLSELAELKSQFFANVSHELRTPLTLILTPLERMIEEGQDVLPEGHVARLRSVVHNTQRLLRLVNQLLDFSRLEAGATRVTFQRCDVRALTEAIVRVFEPFAVSKELTLDLRGAAELPEIYCNPASYDKVLCNLLSNACKFTAPNGVIVVRLADHGDRVTIAVKDSGIGIAEEDLGTIFERFRQVDSSDSRRYEGTGIGLALTKELVELMGGTLAVDSELGVGSTFTVTLPTGKEHIKDPSLITEVEPTPTHHEGSERAVVALAAERRRPAPRLDNEPDEVLALEATPPEATPPEATPPEAAPLATPEVLTAEPSSPEAPPPEAPPPEAPPPEAPPPKAAPPEAAPTEVMTVEPSPAPAADTVDLGRPTILVVEDNAEMRTLIREICQVEFDVLEAEDGRRGLELTRKRQPALVISDVMMPGMDGREMLAQLRAEPATASIPVMLLTATAGGDLRLEGLEGGADDYLIKPFNSRELLARARNLVRLKQQEVALRALNATLERQVLSRTSALERARTLGRYLPPQVVRAIIDEGQAVEVRQERRRLTVFSIELRGFEAVLQAAEPEDVAVMLNGYLSAVIGVAFAAGATIDRFVRDEVVGFFGAPTSEGDQQDAAASVAMARKIWDAAWEVSARWEDLLSVPAPSPTMVLTSGLATVGNFGSVERLDYTAVGGAADDVGSLLQALEPGVLACAQSTWSLLDDAAKAALELPAQTDATLQEVALPDRSQPVSLLRLAGGLDGRDVEETKAESSSARFDAARARDAARSEGPPDQEGELLLDTDGRISAGTLLLERFEVIRYIGGGGMGTVYQAPGSEARARRGDQADPTGQGHRAARAGAALPRGQAGSPDQPRERGPDLRPRRVARPRVHLHGADRGADPAGAAQRRRTATAGLRPAGGATPLRGARRGPRRGRGAPRPQARQHHAPARRPGGDPGLRHRQVGLHAPDGRQYRGSAGHPELHGSRTVHGAGGGPARRHLRAGGGGLRALHRTAALHLGQPLHPGLEALPHPTARPGQPAPRPPGQDRRDHPALPGEGAPGPLRTGAGDPGVPLFTPGLSRRAAPRRPAGRGPRTSSGSPVAPAAGCPDSQARPCRARLCAWSSLTRSQTYAGASTERVPSGKMTTAADPCARKRRPTGTS